MAYLTMAHLGETGTNLVLCFFIVYRSRFLEILFVHPLSINLSDVNIEAIQEKDSYFLLILLLSANVKS